MASHRSRSALLPPLPAAFFARPAELVAPDLIGCRLVKRQADDTLLWGVIVETEAYCQSEPACHGHRRRSPSNETLFGEPGRFYVYVSYGIHHCVNVVTGHADWANGVLLRSACLPGEPERVAAGPALLARRFAIDRSRDARQAEPAEGLWLAPRAAAFQRWLPSPADLPTGRPGAGTTADVTTDASADPDPRATFPSPALIQAPRIGISQGQELPWRWYLRASRSVSRRAPGDRMPSRAEAWTPEFLEPAD
jgi:DNA-3-methyladenine glycosylase